MTGELKNRFEKANWLEDAKGFLARIDARLEDNEKRANIFDEAEADTKRAIELNKGQKEIFDKLFAEDDMNLEEEEDQNTEEDNLDQI